MGEMEGIVVSLNFVGNGVVWLECEYANGIARLIVVCDKILYVQQVL